MELLAWIFLVPLALVAVYWTIVWIRVERIVRDRPTVRAGLAIDAPKEGWPAVSIVIPAHNEERVIDACCTSLRKQNYPSYEVIFVLDRCTDRTREIVARHAAEDERIRFIEIDHCPDDWAGKCNAARHGAEVATGEWLLFTDADTEFDPDLIRAAVAIAREQKASLFSLLSSLTYDEKHERIAQPVAGMTLVRMYPFQRSRSKKPVRPFANGQFMLFDRTWYERVGGHAAVKDDLLEDLALARLVQRRGGRAVTYLADQMLRCSMYDSMDALRNGWKRIFIEACRRKPARLKQNAWRVIGGGVGVPVLQGFALLAVVLLAWVGEFAWVGVLLITFSAGLIVQTIALTRIYRLSGVPLSAIAHYPRGCWIIGRAMLEGAHDLEARRPIRWGGREYILEPRR